MMVRRFCFGVSLILSLAVLCNSASAAVTNDPNIITAATYTSGGNTGDLEIVEGDGLQDGILSHADRTYLFDDIDNLNGIEFIKTRVDDKNVSDAAYEVTVDKAGKLLLFIDNRVGDDDDTTPPTITSGGIMGWVADDGFVQTSYSVSTATTPMTVYAKDVTAGTYTLDAQYDGTGRIMYLVAAIPANYNIAPYVSGVPASATIAIDGTLSLNIPAVATDNQEYGDNPGIASSVWTASDAGVTFDNASALDVNVSFPEAEGSYTLTLTVTDNDNGTTVKTVEVEVKLPEFALECTNWVSVANDDMDAGGKASVTFREKKTVIYIRNLNVRRRIGFVDFDISSVKEEGKVFANTFLTMNRDKGSGGGDLYIFGIKEDYDNEDLNSTNWNSVPGLVNDADPTVPISMDTLELNEVSPLLMQVSSGELPVDEFVDLSPSVALEEFLNTDDDGHVLLMLVTFLDEGATDASYEISSPTNGNGEDPDTGVPGIALRGNVILPVKPYNPEPANGGEASIDLAQLSWVNPEGVVSSDVYLGVGEPNDVIGLGDGFELIADDVTGSTAAIPANKLDDGTTYTWIVVTTDDESVIQRGYNWRFTAIRNSAPEVSVTPEMQYAWLGNTGEAYAESNPIVATVTDDGRKQATPTITWEAIDTPGNVEVTIVEISSTEVKVQMPVVGTYTIQISANDGENITSETAQVVVASDACEAAKLVPGFEASIADFDNNCIVDINDFARFAEEWLNSTALTKD